MFEILEHTADAGFRIEAADCDELFADAGRALFSLMVEEIETVRPATEMTFNIEGSQLEYLLVDWLSELLFQFESKRMLFSEFDAAVTDAGLAARARGEPLDPTRHSLVHEIKAVTYHELSVKETDAGWSASVIVDI